MQFWQIILLSVLEGLTEFVPVSSTGHLILASRFLGLGGPAVDAFLVVVQLGALLAAVFYYRRCLWQMAVGVLTKQAQALALARNLILGSLPLLVCGYVFGSKIKALLFAPSTVSFALFLGGVAMLLLDQTRRRAQATFQEPAKLPPGRAGLVGFVHLLALWPGTSRSLASMAGALLVGLPTAAAADFAFLLAIPTLGCATVYELLKEGRVLWTEIGPAAVAAGLAVSFAVGWLVIAAFLRFLRGHGLFWFALYRMALAVAVFWLWHDP